MRLYFRHAGRTYRVDLQAVVVGWEAWVEGRRYVLSANRGRELVLEIDGKQHKLAWAKQGRKIWVQSGGGRSVELERVVGGQSAGSAAAAESILRAPMPGQVTKVLAQPGTVVKAGAVLVLIEAMKMEVRIQAPQDAKVAQVTVQEGQSVEKEQVLVELEPSHAG